MKNTDIAESGKDEVLDRRILALLKDNARLSYTEIGHMVGLSRVAVKNRIDSLEKNGAILGYHAMTDENAGPNGVRFCLIIETFPEAFQDVVERLADDRRIKQIYTTTGQCSLHVCGFASNMEDVASFSRNLYRRTDGIKRLECSILTSVLKDSERGIDYVRSENETGR